MKKIFFYALLLCVVFVSAIVSAQELKGTLTAELRTRDGALMSGGQVFLFNDAAGPPPSQERYWRVPDHVALIDSKGKFSIDLPSGKFYLGAIKRVSDENLGPPREGDLFFASSDDAGKPKAYLIRSGAKLDLGVLSVAAPFKRSTVAFTGVTAIEGTVLDPDGKPVQGALAFAYMKPEMTGKPTFVSERTGSDGKYILRVHSGGKYYLKARDKYKGGPPSEGDLMGSYGHEALQAAVKKPGIGIEVKSGEFKKGIDIRTTRFSGRGDTFVKTPKVSP